MERHQSKERDLHMVFIDLEKNMIKCKRSVVEDLGKGVCITYIRAIQDMYDGVTISVKTSGSKTMDFPIRIELH